MKKLTIALLTLTIFTSCKKDETTPSSGASTGSPNSINYNAKAPDCIITKMDSKTDNSLAYLEFDSQRRLTRATLVEGTKKVESLFFYGAKTIINEQWDLSKTPKLLTNKSTKYLNKNGLVDSMVFGDGYQVNYFYYRNDGFLQREIVWNNANSAFFGESHEYQNGNRIKTYGLRFKPNEKEPYDSSLSETYTYHGNHPNYFAAFEAWIRRDGKPSANDYTQKTEGSNIQTVKITKTNNILTRIYSFDGGLETKVDHTLLCK